MSEDKEAILKYAKNALEENIQYLRDMAAKEQPLSHVLEMPLEECPRYINDDHELKREMVLAKLRREDLLANRDFIMQTLWDTNFDIDDYRNLGVTDGAFMILQDIFQMLGDTENSKKAYEWIYRND